MNSNDNSLKVLISSFACGPNWGSEIGMGWNWVKYMSNYCQLIIITEKWFEGDITIALLSLKTKYKPRFNYIDIGDKGRSYFWEQGSYSFYKYYKIWQKKSLKLAQNILSEEKIDIIHQLNLIGFREPGYLWMLSVKKPFIWGPIGGFNQIPFRYIWSLDLKNLLFYSLKNILHYSQVYFHIRVRRAFKHAHLILADSSSTKKIIERVYRKNVVLMNETGATIHLSHQPKQFMIDGVLKLIWIGKIQGLKALPIALKVIRKLINDHKITLTIVGDGPDEKQLKALTTKMGLDDFVCFIGKIPNKNVLEIMQNHDIFFFTSLKEGTPHVILEALSCGLPVVCHDACGHGDIINDSCGIKIPMVSYSKSITLFSNAIKHIYNNPNLLMNYRLGCLNRIKEVSWEVKSNEMYNYYLKVYENFNHKP
jgi:glycosyltransferase involved in cell wall biosynthesis